MIDETVPNLAVVASNNDEHQLTAREQRLIRNFRAVKGGAQEMLLDLSDQYKRTLPAERVKLELL